MLRFKEIAVAVLVLYCNESQAFLQPNSLSFCTKKLHPSFLSPRTILAATVERHFVSPESFENAIIYHETAIQLADDMLQTTPGSLSDAEMQQLEQTFSLVCSTSDQIAQDQAKLAQNVLERLLDEWHLDSTQWQPTVAHFEQVVGLWNTALFRDDATNTFQQRHVRTDILPVAVDHVYRLWYLWRKNSKLLYHDVQNNSSFFEAVLRTVSASRAPGNDRNVRKLFDDMGHNPTPSMYHSLITALAKSRQGGAANRAERYLRQAAEVFPPADLSTDMFNTVLTAWAKSTVHYGPERAEKLLFWMDELDAGTGTLRPNASSFTSLLDAYTQQGDWESLGKAERIFNRLLDEFLHDGDASLEPSIATWSIVLRAWAKQSKYNKRAPVRAERLLRRMEALHEEGKISFGPDRVVYVSVLNAWAFSKTIEGPRKAQEILLEMYEKYMDGDDTMKPSAKSTKAVLGAWTKSSLPNAMDCAETVMDSVEDHLLEMLQEGDEESEEREALVQDISAVYSTMLFGWTKVGEPERAQDYLNDMMDHNLAVNSFCFDRVIEANTKKNDEHALERTQQLFDLMEQYQSKGLLKPNERLYTSYIRAITKGKVENMAETANRLLQNSKEMYRTGDNEEMKPTVFTYNSVLVACAETAELEPEDSTKRAAAFKIAIRTFNELRALASRREETQGPDHVSYANMLRCANLLPDGEQKDSLIRSTFLLSCKNGLFNEFVLRDLQAVAKEELWRDLLQWEGDVVDITRLPSAWRRQSLVREYEKKARRDNFQKGNTRRSNR